MFGSNGGGEVNHLTKARLCTILMVAAFVAMLLAKMHPLGLNDGGYW